jgi:hypothetical protein
VEVHRTCTTSAFLAPGLANALEGVKSTHPQRQQRGTAARTPAGLMTAPTTWPGCANTSRPRSAASPPGGSPACFAPAITPRQPDQGGMPRTSRRALQGSTPRSSCNAQCSVRDTSANSDSLHFLNIGHRSRYIEATKLIPEVRHVIS